MGRRWHATKFIDVCTICMYVCMYNMWLGKCLVFPTVLDLLVQYSCWQNQSSSSGFSFSLQNAKYVIFKYFSDPSLSVAVVAQGHKLVTLNATVRFDSHTVELNIKYFH